MHLHDTDLDPMGLGLAAIWGAFEQAGAQNGPLPLDMGRNMRTLPVVGETRVTSPLSPWLASSSDSLAGEATLPSIVVMIVHGTFPRGFVKQLRRKLQAAFARLLRKSCPESELWPVPAVDENARWWFESNSEFEKDLINLTERPHHNIKFMRFLWSGENSFAERADAADKLRKQLLASIAAAPGVPHVIVAHSHGGTIAVAALDKRRRDETPRVQGLLTLGTPFLRLAWRWRRDANAAEAGTDGPRAFAFLPATLLVMAPLLTADYALRASAATGVFLLALSILAAMRLSIVGATGIALLTILFGGEALRTDIIAVALGALFACFPFDAWLPNRLAVRGVRYVQDAPIILACPLLALRMPRDEASLVIGLGQVMQGAWYWQSKVVGLLLWPWAIALRAATALGTHPAGPNWWRRALSTFALFGVVFASYGLIGELASVLGIWTPPSMGPAPMPAWWIALMLIVYGMLAAVVLCISWALLWAIPSLAISLVAGGEAFFVPVATQVDAEPLPNASGEDGKESASMSLEILYGAHPCGLNHSLYQSGEVRRRVAAWLLMHLDAQN